MRNTSRLSNMTILAVAGILLISFVLFATDTAMAAKPETSPVFWSWDFEGGDTSNPVGTSTLNRNNSGISGTYKTDVLTPGNAATLWFIVFNYPEECAAGPYMCSPLDLGFGAAAQGDFLLASGHVIGGSGKGNFGGHLNVGDTRGSGFAEVNCPETGDCAPGLIDPHGALVVLAIHDHGPKQKGQTLKAQISSFLGGCEGPFNGNEFGFATGPHDIPDAAGECSTIQFSPHVPQP